MSYYDTNFAVTSPYFEDKSLLESGAPVAGSGESQDWYLNPATEGDRSRFQGSTLLDMSGNHLMDPHAASPSTHGRLETGESLCY